jgi:HEAT repeat protein
MPVKPWDALVPVLAKGTKWQAASVAIVLAALKSPDAAIPEKTEADLYAILSDPATEDWRWNITATLVTRLAEAKLKDHVALWTWGVNHPSPLVPLPSLRALAKTGEAGKPAEAALAAMLRRPHPPLLSIVLKPEVITDGQIGLEKYHPAFEPLFILEAMAATKADPELMVEPLMHLTHNLSEYVRLDAAVMLGQLDVAKLSENPHPHAAKVLADLATLPYGKVRDAAVRQLGNMGPKAASELETLISLLKDGNGVIRTEAANGLGKMGAAAEPALPALRDALRFAELDTQDAAAAINAAIQAIEAAVPDKEMT